ncbi:tRNA preQ1(34) S-adenosylmethionine ribosyltransferase-isomerase QueA, partial [bacterium]
MAAIIKKYFSIITRMQMLKLSDFDYHLPRELIAQYPSVERDASRLMVVDRRKNKIEHRVFSDIKDYFSHQDLLVLNNTKVLPSRLFGKRITGGKVEIFLVRHIGGLVFEAMLKPGRLKFNEKIVFDNTDIYAVITGRNEARFQAESLEDVYKLGVMPLPPYIKRKSEESDTIRYQTVYAKNEGAIAAPTAGLHFTHKLFEQLRDIGADIGYLTLHVGLGTFKPVKSDVIAEHKMDAEYFQVPQETSELIEKAHAHNKRVFAVGTTSLRALESYALGQREGDTRLFVYPGYKFKEVDALVTNFHLPKTTL